MINGAFSGVILFFLFRIIRKTDKANDDYHKLLYTWENTRMEHRSEMKILAKDIETANSWGKSLNEMRECIGVLKRDQVAVFRRIDELREAQKKHETLYDTLRDKIYELKK